MDTDIFAAIRRLGIELSPPMLEGSQALFAPLAPRPTPHLCSVERNLEYGPDPRHRLDVFHSERHSRSDGTVVLVFVHGGGFVRGDKGAPEAAFYNNVGAWAVHNGLVGVTMTYRLAPGARWPSGAEDIWRALEWLAGNAQRFGGSPDRIVLMGQSAGAAHVAGFVAGHHDRTSTRMPAAAILLSGIYDLTTVRINEYEQAYFGEDRARHTAASTLEPLIRTDIPCLFTVSELDPPNFQQQAARLVEGFWAAKRVWPRLLYQQGHNHITPILQLGTSCDTLGGELLAFIRRLA
jgi:acetyl esterase/lipase